jgi:hypothetical protein
MSDLSPELEKLVVAGRSSSRPTSTDFERVMVALQGRLGAAAVGSQLVSSTAAGSALGSLSGKFVAIALAGLALVVGGVAFISSVTPAAEQSSLVAVSNAKGPAAPEAAITPRASIANVEEQVPPVPSSGLVASPVKSGPSSVSVREPSRAHDSLSEEVAILTRAETELHSGRSENALKLLNEHERKFPNGILAEERTAARIQALCALGRVAEANTQLARLRPGSLHGETSRQACASTAANRISPRTSQSAPGLTANKP